MRFHTGDLEELPHKILGLMVEEGKKGGPWWVRVVHGPSHMESTFQGYVVAQNGREITIDRTTDDAELIGIQVVIHEDWIYEVIVP